MKSRYLKCTCRVTVPSNSRTCCPDIVPARDIPDTSKATNASTVILEPDTRRFCRVFDFLCSRLVGSYACANIASRLCQKPSRNNRRPHSLWPSFLGRSQIKLLSLIRGIEMLICTRNHLTAASASNSSCFAVFTFSPHTANRYFHRSRSEPVEFLIPFSICSFSSRSSSCFACRRDWSSFRASAGSGTLAGDGEGPAFLFLALPLSLTNATLVEVFFSCFATGLRFGKGAALGVGLAVSPAAGTNGGGSSHTTRV